MDPTTKFGNFPPGLNEGMELLFFKPHHLRPIRGETPSFASIMKRAGQRSDVGVGRAT